jgi:hypothetical protein
MTNTATVFTAETAPRTCCSCGQDALSWADDFRSYKCRECGTYESQDA